MHLPFRPAPSVRRPLASALLLAAAVLAAPAWGDDCPCCGGGGGELDSVLGDALVRNRGGERLEGDGQVALHGGAAVFLTALDAGRRSAPNGRKDQSLQAFLFASVEARLLLPADLSVGARINANEVTPWPARADKHLGQDTAFDNLGVFVEELYLAWRPAGGPCELFGGKFSPRVGMNNGSAPVGLGRDVVPRITEMVGFGAALDSGRDDGWAPVPGRHRLEVSVFSADNTFLSGSLADGADQRGTRGDQDGGLSNTDRLDSWSLRLSGRGLLGGFAKGLGYSLGHAHQENGAPNRPGNRNNQMPGLWTSAGLSWEIHLGEAGGQTLTLTPEFEFLSLDRVNGEMTLDRDFTIVGLGAQWGGWYAKASHVNQRDRAQAPSHPHSGFSVQGSVGYRVQEGAWKGFGVEVGAVHQDGQPLGLNHVEGTDYGLTLSWVRAF